jgi:uncharacterized protein (TIGR04255 family)
MTDRGGQLPNAPLFFVLASMRFGPWLSLPEALPQIQDELRDRFPDYADFTMEHGVTLPPAEPGAPEQQQSLGRRQIYALMAADRGEGCHLAVDQVIVYAREYTGFDRFGEAFELVAGAVERHARHFDVSAMGIRYLDRIAPLEGETLEQYLRPGFLPATLGSGDFHAQGGMTQTVYRTKSGVLQAQCWTGSGYTAVPSDVLPLLAMAHDLAGDSQLMGPLPEGQCTLDSDSIWTSIPPTRMGAREAVAKLRELRADAKAFFEAACSEHAFEVWEGDRMSQPIERFGAITRARFIGGFAPKRAIPVTALAPSPGVPLNAHARATTSFKAPSGPVIVELSPQWAICRGGSGFVKLRAPFPNDERLARPAPSAGAPAARAAPVEEESPALHMAPADAAWLKEELALSMAELAELSGVTRKAAYDWFTHATPHLGTAQRLAGIRAAVEPVEARLRRFIRGAWRAPVSKGESLFDLLRTIESPAVAAVAAALAAARALEPQLRDRLARANAPSPASQDYGTAHTEHLYRGL